MIIRKPYAFLIKYFQKINIILLVLVGFVFYKTIQLHRFTKNYLDTTIYNKTLDSINNYANIYVFLAFILIIIISAVLVYLLRLKDKPYFSYVFIGIANIPVLVLFIYINSYFTYRSLDVFNLVTARVLSDLTFIASIPYYIMLLILLIRSLGIDLKNFGFQEDKEFLEINEEDREEIEVQVGFDKYKWKRKLKYYIRNSKYFVLEHKIPLLLVFILLIGVGVFQFYQYYYVENRIYTTNESIISNNYKLKVKNTYLTDKDYSGKIVSEDGRFFVLVDLEVTNMVALERTFDIEKVLLYVDDTFYVPTTRFNSYFKDMGNLYKGISLKSKETTSYLLIYEVNKPDEKANFVLKYQDLNRKNSKLIQIKIGVRNISEFKQKGEETTPNNFTIPFNESEKVTFSLNKISVLDSIEYTYQSCREDGTCPIYKRTQYADTNKKILYAKFYSDDLTKKEFLDFIKNYAEIEYTVGGKERMVPIKYSLNLDYKGDYLYLDVPSEIENAESIRLVFTVRTYQYTYKLKGE